MVNSARFASSSTIRAFVLKLFYNFAVISAAMRARNFLAACVVRHKVNRLSDVVFCGLVDVHIVPPLIKSKIDTCDRTESSHCVPSAYSVGDISNAI